MEKLYYKIKPTKNIFFNLNNRAIEHLTLFGNWINLIDRNIDEECECGNLYIGSSADSLALSGVIWENRVLPALIYGIIKDNVLLKYRILNFENEDPVWIYEVEDTNIKSSYSNIDLKCLSDDMINRMYEWTQEEIELAEVIMEYKWKND